MTSPTDTAQSYPSAESICVHSSSFVVSPSVSSSDSSETSVVETVVSRPVAFAIPPQDRVEFHALPLSEKENIQYLLEAFAHVAGSANKERAFRTLEISFKGRHGFSYQSLKRRYYDYLEHACDWRRLVNAAVCPRYAVVKATSTKQQQRSVGLPAAFLEYWHKLGLQNKRKWRPAFKKLKRLWREGESVPGYGRWKEWFARQYPHSEVPAICPDLFPEGWSYANLMRHKAPKAQEVAARIGRAAAREFLPHILGTRQGLRFLEHVTFDDVKTDFRVLDPASGQVCDLWLLVAHDKATDMRLAYGMRPAVARDDGTQSHLKLRDMKQLAGSLLLRYGIPPYPVTWKVERGTATFSAATTRAIDLLFQSRISVSYSSMIGGKAPSGYREKAVGNSRGKAGHEAGNNLLHNECADLPGQTGPRYDKRPTELAAREQELRDLINRAGKIGLPAELASRLRFSLLTVKQAKEILDAVFERINQREEHECEGFEEVIVWRNGPSDQWRPITDPTHPSDPSQTSHLEYKQRLETPYERMVRLATPYMGQSGSDQWSHVHPADIVHFFEDSHRIVEINKRGEIAFDHEKKLYTFSNPDPLGQCGTHFRPGQEYLAFFHPQDLAWIHLATPKGGYVSSWPQRTLVPQNDKAALEKAFQYTAQVAKLHHDALAARHADEAAANEARRQHNEAILAEHAANQSAIVVSDQNPEGVIPIAPAREGWGEAPAEPSPVGTALHFLRAATAATKRANAAAERDEAALNAAADAALDDCSIGLASPARTSARSLSNDNDESF